MKGYLFDENVSIPLRFVPSLPAIHATSLGASWSDEKLWSHARKNELVIVSKDAELADRAMAASPPPWVVHVRFGNVRRSVFDALLAVAWPKIEALLPVQKLITVYSDRILTVQD